MIIDTWLKVRFRFKINMYFKKNIVIVELPDMHVMDIVYFKLCFKQCFY